MIEVEKTDIPDLLVIKPRHFKDDRGFFAETYHKAKLAEAGVVTEFVQDNHSLSEQVGTVRGLHFQTPSHAQAKLVRCAAGALFDVAVDIRKGSPTYGKWFGVELTLENGYQLFVPEGFAHGFVTRQPNTIIAYKCSDFYNQPSEGALRYDDPDLAIEWGLGDAPVMITQKDAQAGLFAEFDSPFVYQSER